MKIKAKKKELSKALQAAVGVATQKELNPILENVLFRTDKESLSLYATDLGISLTYILPSETVKVEEEGCLLVPAGKMYSFIKEIPDPEIYLETEELNGCIVSQDGKVKILGENVQKFPEIPQFTESESLKIKRLDLQELIKKSIFATTTEKTRYELDNILAIINSDKIKFISTDGKRLAIIEKTCQNQSNISTSVTIPRQGLQQVERLISIDAHPSEEDFVTFGIVENQILFKTSQAMLSTRLSECKFPPYEKVIPEKISIEISLGVRDFASALKRIALMTDEKNKIVEMHFTKGHLRMNSSDIRYGEAYLNMDVKYQGKPFDIKFNPDFFMDMLKILDQEEITLGLNDPTSPGLVKEGDNFKYVILPIRPQEEKVSDAEEN